MATPPRPDTPQMPEDDDGARPPPAAHLDAPDKLVVPPVEVLREIERRQNAAAARLREKKATELGLRKTQTQQTATDEQRQTAAATMIQRNYRGYRARRMLMGHDLDPSTRWVEVSCAGHDYGQLLC